MRKRLVLFLTAALLLASSSVHAATVHLTPSDVQADSTALQSAMNQLQPGDTLYLAGGEYTPSGGLPSYISNTLDIRPTDGRGVSGRADAWIAVRNEPGQHPVLRLGTGGTTGFALVNVAFWRVEGLELIATDDANEYATGIATQSHNSNAGHDIQFVNNIVHGFGAAGIYGAISQHLIEGNTVYNNAWRAHNNASGINLVQPLMTSTDNTRFGGALGNPQNAYSIIIRNNRSYFNRNLVPDSDHGSDGITDGNGIMLDIFDAREGYVGFGGKTLIANNTIYNNGGAGVHAFNSSNVDIFHNTLFQNGWIANGTQMSNVGSNNRWFNNVVVGGNPNIYAPGTLLNGGYTNGGNRGWQNVGDNTNVQWNKNAFYDTSDSSFPSGSIVGSNPLFIDRVLDVDSAPLANFRLQAGSSLINAGVLTSTTGISVDHDGNSRDANPDIGAHEFIAESATIASTGGVASASSTGIYETPASAFDNNASTKWLGDNDAQAGAWLQYTFANNTSKIVRQYSITSANDNYGRDPRAWMVQGSNGTTWTTLDTRFNQWFPERGMKVLYRFRNSRAYRMYRLVSLQNSGSAEYGIGRIQLSEWTLRN